MKSDGSYPRDLIGYGRNPPRARWPGNARVAVQFVLNYEEGGENCVLHGDAGSEQFLSELFNPASYPARPGYNNVGRVTAVGPDVTSLAVGDLVASSANHGSAANVRLDRLENESAEAVSAPILAAAHAYQIGAARDELASHFHVERDLLRRGHNHGAGQRQKLA